MTASTADELTIEDRAAIEDLYARYAWALDRGEDDAFAEVFTPESTFEDPSGHYTGTNTPYDVMAAMRSNSTFPGRQHWVGQIVMEGTTTEVRAKAFVMVTARHESGATNLHLVAAYFDHLKKIDGQWRIVTRLAKPWRGDLLAGFPEVQSQPQWSRNQQQGAAK
ncbi:MAG TPA: nuclear transport factor 2 family protein [Actinomycetaceae bacterium]|nr:nuclear transport factor 2 family protein [Actinomycetaceae bacterium]